MPIEPLKAHCPKCKGKPTTGQRKLTETQRDRLTGLAWKAISARFETAYACKVCGAIYSYQDGFSTYVTRMRNSA